MTEWQRAAQGLADILGYGTVRAVEEDRMAENERGWSGAEVVRKKVYFADGSAVPMIFKRAERRERCVMQRLTGQAQCVPAAYSADLLSDAPAWMAMEDLGPQKLPPCGEETWLCKAAESLASVHGANMGKGEEMPWLPEADGAYWQSVVTQLSVDHVERKMEQDPGFCREFGKYLPRLRTIGTRFANDMTALWRERGSLTLTHGDLQLHDGAHLYDWGGRVRIIDFGFCRYAPLYIDLAGWFGRDTLRLYYDALREKGSVIPYADFEERAAAASRYPGFIYLCPSVMDWREGPTERTGRRLLQALRIILDGDLPERKTRYSEALFRQLLQEHRQRG